MAHRSLYSRWYALLTIAAVWLVPAFGHAAEPAAPAAEQAVLPALTPLAKLTPAQKQQEDALVASLSGGRFAWELVKQKTCAPALLDLVAGARPASVVAAALRALPDVFAARDDAEHTAVSPEYRRVVLGRLVGTPAEVQRRAFGALPPLLQGKVPDEPTLAALGKLLSPAQAVAVRVAAVEALGQLSLYGVRDTPTLPALLQSALADPEPAVRIAGLALLVAMGRSQSFVERAGAPLQRSIEAALASGPLPQRVVAASALAVVRMNLSDSAAQAKAQTQLAALLAAPEPALRAAGAMALVQLPHPPALARLVELLSDQGSAVVEFVGPAGLDGETIKVPVSALGSEPRVVAHAAVQAVMIASNPVTGDGFVCEAPGHSSAQADLQACIAKARAWYAKSSGAKP